MKKKYSAFLTMCLLATSYSVQANSLQVNGLEASIDNGAVQLELKANGTIKSLIKNGVNLVQDRAADRETGYLDFHAERKTWPLVPEKLKVIMDTDKLTHVAYIDNTSLLALEYHYILKKGDSGFYGYVIAKNNKGDVLKLSEMRTVYRMDRTIFDHVYNGSRTSLIPRQAEMKKGKWLQDETYDMGEAGYKYTNSNVYSKYDYAAYLQDTPTWGAFGNGFGFWVMPLSNEYHPGGPLKQDLTVHYDTIVCNYLTSAHFGTGDFYVPQEWEKLYGPWYIYINTGDEAKVIADANKRAAKEQKAWPCRWMNEKLYPVKRGSVSGKITLADGSGLSNAQIILAKPGADIPHEKASYIFAAQADAKGNFVIKDVRPGEYELTAYPDGGSITDPYKSAKFTVTEKGLKLGTISWQLPKREVLWQLGTADHKANEFALGNSERNYVWQTKVPENLSFDVAKNKAANDWYYAQTKNGEWQIKFNLPQVDGVYHLQLALAGFSTGMGKKYKDVYAEVLVNDQVVKKLSYANDQTVYRSSTTSGTYHKEDIELDSAQLQAGENVITIRNHGASLLYDTILLEK